jgi:hypothetical protein
VRAASRDTFNSITIAAYTAEKHLETIGDFGSGRFRATRSRGRTFPPLTSNAKVHIATAASGGAEDQTEHLPGGTSTSSRT